MAPVSFSFISLASILGWVLGLPSTGAPTVQLGSTTLYGAAYPLGQEFFGAIPYAEPPLWDLRFRRAILKESPGGTEFNATSYGPACLQPAAVLGGVSPSSEDCLTINVFRPSGTTEGDDLPVMAWIHGGGFYVGAASAFNGSHIVAQSISRDTPVIYVSFQYRVGPLGFPPGQEAADAGILNLGLRDQITALEWIQLNIGVFGGDKDKVTVFGESAGAISIAILFLNSGLEKLVRGAILESGSATTAVIFNATRNQANWDNFVNEIPECASSLDDSTSLDCLRTANGSSFIDAITVSSLEGIGFIPWALILDGRKGLIPDLPSKLLSAGKFAHVPFITGANLDEGTAFASTGVNSTKEIYEVFGKTDGELPGVINGILNLYPNIPALGAPYNTGDETFGFDPQFKRLSAILGDLAFHEPRRSFSQAASCSGLKSFGYLFTDKAPAITSIFPTYQGATHGTEVVYVYGWLPGNTLSTQIVDYWLSFVTSLDPNDGIGSERPEWPEYALENPLVMHLNATNLTAIADTYRSQHMDFIAEHSSLFRR
ncbi:extracellular triacylglycerol lipase precursor [Mycena latifolia]|nr:extracellular triacylglycerol lipase precursor [Mycena latifolia]